MTIPPNKPDFTSINSFYKSGFWWTKPKPEEKKVDEVAQESIRPKKKQKVD